MKRLSITLSLMLFSILYANSQSKLVPVSKSVLTGIELPAGTKQDSRILSTAAAKTVLQMTAADHAMTAGEQVEVFSMPPSVGNQIFDQLKTAAQKAGWEMQPFTNDAAYSLLKNQQRTMLMYFQAMKKETALYISPVSSEPAPVQTISSSETTAIVQPATPAVQQQEPVVPPAEATRPQQSTASADAGGFTYTTINFDDGWNSSIDADYVKVVKGNMKVLIYYPIEITDQQRNSNQEMSDYYWNLLVVPSYQVKSAIRLVEGVTYFKTHFIEGDAVDPGNGKHVYLAMNVLINSGMVTTILAIATDKNSYLQQFPEPKNLASMSGYNRFAVAAKDITGNWSSSSGASVNLYNTYTGNYAGMNYASSSDSFLFNNDGTYSSKHSGASSVYGNNTHYTQEYKGKLTVTNWDISMTNRWKDGTDNFHVWFEVVRGGRILHLQDKKSSSMKYDLVKVK